MFKDIKNWYTTSKLLKLQNALVKNGFDCKILNDKSEISDFIVKNIDVSQSVGIGGSVTIRELEIDNLLNECGNKVFNHWDSTLAPNEKLEVTKKQPSSDVFITSTNAVTMDGKLVNIDGNGNRVVSMIFGPKKVIVFIGINKITNSLEEALNRIKDTACPMNSKRIGLNTPCGKSGECYDCSSDGRMCNITTIIEKCPPTIDYKIILVNKELGF